MSLKVKHKNNKLVKPILPGLTWGFYVFEIPESQVGGIADVAEGLPRALVRLPTTDQKPHNIFRVTPYYKDMQSMTKAIKINNLEKIAVVSIPYQENLTEVSIHKRVHEDMIIDYFLVNDIFDRAYKKSDHNNPGDALFEIVAFNSTSAALIILGVTKVNIPFVADWQTGLMLSYLLESVHEPEAMLNGIEISTEKGILNGSDLVNSFKRSGQISKIVPICWINNEAYRGQFVVKDFMDFKSKTGLVSQTSFESSRWITPERPWELYTILLKLSAETVKYGYNGEVVTVSKTYAKEIMGLDLKPGDHPGMLFGIFGRIGVKGVLNGVSYLWRFVNDYSEKAKAKLNLQKKLGLSEGEDKILAFMVSRLVSQKGVSLLIEGQERIIQLLKDFPELQIIIGGKPEEYWRKPLEEFKKQLEAEFPGRIKIELRFLPDELVERIFIAGDIQLFPSLYEPCGTLPKAAFNMVITVGRETGGIAEGAFEIIGTKSRHGNAVLFKEYTPEAFITAWRKTMGIARNKKRWERIQKSAPATVSTWLMQAREYAELIRPVLINKGFELD